MRRALPSLSAFLAVVLLALPCACSAQAPSPPVAAKLRGLLPFPEETLRPKMEMNFGLGYSLAQGYVFSRQGSDHAGRIVAVRRQMTGGAADAPRYRLLGGLYRGAGLPIKSKAAFRQSKALYQAVLQQRPHDGAALAGYALTLQAEGQAAAAEAYLRKALQISPRSADVWLALGSVLEGKAFSQTDAKTHREREAGAAYDKAVSLAPQNPAVWAMRGEFRSLDLPLLQGKTPSRDGLSDCKRAASLLPHNPDAQAMVSTIDYGYVESHYSLATSPEAAAKETPEADRRAKKAVQRITAIAESTHGAQSAEAYMARAWVQFQFFYDPQGAQKSLALALRQNPRQQDAIDYQMHVAAVTGNDALLAAACRRELRRRPQQYLRVLLAYADFSIAQQKPRYWREGLRQMEMAHAAAPDDYACALGLATFLLEAGQTVRADLRLNKLAMQAKMRPKEQQTEYDITNGIGAALAGNQGDARRFLRSALQDDPHSQAAKSVLTLISPPPPAAAKLRRLLPFPEATLDPKMELNFGLGFSLEQGYHFLRQSSDYAAQVVAIRRQMTGGLADAAQYRRLGSLYDAAGLRGKSNAAYRQSEAICWNALRRNPHDGLALADYGRTLTDAHQAAKAEAFLRQAAQAVPNSPDVWLALGYVLDAEATPKTEAAKHYARDAGLAYDRAVRLAPQNPVVWAMRGKFRSWNKANPFSRNGLSDYAKAASLLPRNPDAQALVATTDCFSFEVAHHIFTSLKAAKMEPAASDHRAEMYLRRITAIAQSTQGAPSAEAYTARAWVQFEFFFDLKGAQKSLALALRQNPRQQDAIDYQMHVAAVTDNDVLWAAACRRELRRRPEIRLRIMLADADFNLAAQKPKYLREARGQMELAHAAAPRDNALRLALAVLLLKAGQAADLSRAAALLGDIPPPASPHAEVQPGDYDLTRGIAAALTGQDDEARRFLTLARQADPHNRPTMAALALLPK